ncbi:MAG: class I SAM-dependent methyltransferase [Candidatus Rokuibacteriota bacterium]
MSAPHPAEAERAAASAAPLLPPSLVPFFGSRFTRSHLLFDEYVYRLTVRVFADARLDAAAGEWGSAEDVVTRGGFDPRSLVPVDWMLRHLAARGVLARKEGDAGWRFRAEHGLPAVDAAPVLAEQRAHDPGCLPSYTLAETVARDYPSFLRGERSGEEILLAPTRLPLWTAYFSNDNALYAVNNAVGAAAVETWRRPGPASILELGGGLGSATLAVLERLAASGRLGEVARYRFTELVPAFLRRAERSLQGRFADAKFLTFAPLDMNRAFGEQGVELESVSIVYAVNTLHVAHDLAFTLGEVRRALAPGGQLIASECIRPAPGHTLYPEFVFNLLETFRAPRLHPAYRPNGGFLTPEQWTSALATAGFRDVRVLPDIARLRDTVSNFYVAVVGAARPT